MLKNRLEKEGMGKWGCPECLPFLIFTPFMRLVNWFRDNFCTFPLPDSASVVVLSTNYIEKPECFHSPKSNLLNKRATDRLYYSTNVQLHR